MKVLNLFSWQRSLHLIHILPFLCHEVAANTEIINFSSTREPTVDLPLDVLGNWSTLHPTENERRWSIEPAALHTPLHQACSHTGEHPPSSTCPHELWLLLDLDDERWSSYSTFTLRLSWAASTPADFEIALYSPRELLARRSERALPHASAPLHTPPSSSSSSSLTSHASTTRSRYARIRAVHAGVPTPSYEPERLKDEQQSLHPDSSSSTVPTHAWQSHRSDVVSGERQREGGGSGSAVPFNVILEPVYGGVLPATLLPTVGLLIPIVLAAAALVPWVAARLEPFVRQAKADLKAEMTRANKDR